MKRTYCHTITAPCNVKELLLHYYHMSATMISHLKQSGGIVLNGRPVYVTGPAAPGDLLELTITEEGKGDILPEHIPLEILYDDLDLTVFNKPPFMPTHPSAFSRTGTVANAILGFWGEDFVFRAVSRLDKNTSGLMVVAKNPYVHQRLCSQLHRHTYRRYYQAVLDGFLPQNEGTIRFPIGRCSDSIIKRCITPDGKPAVTHYHVLRRKNGRTLVELELETGRTHQIRVHMAAMGYPVTGDFLYGKEDHAIICRQALHCARLDLRHPILDKDMSFSCPLAHDIAKLME